MKAAAAAEAASAASAAAAAEAAAAAAAAAAAEAAAAAARAAGTGLITVRYAEYAPQLPIADGCLTAAAIDEELALTFVYPKCEIHLTRAPVRGIDWRTVDWARLEARDAAGAFSGLVRDTEYWAVVVEDGAERARYEREQAARAAAFAARAGGGGGGQPALLREDRQLSLESCSCIEGTPCATPECCLDWSGRFENAKRVMIESRGAGGARAHSEKIGVF